jgi:hypothetical protein
MMHNRLHVSRGNRKIGETANLSLCPVSTCVEGVPCAGDCYARRAMRNKQVITAWVENTMLAIWDLEEFERQLREWIVENRPSFFRWHVGGEVPGEAYKRMMIRVALEWPETNFLCFTKRYELKWRIEGTREKPTNLIVLWSAWPGWPMPSCEEREAHGVEGVAWIEGDERVPKGTERCKGSCLQCRGCWEGKSVVLKRH